MPYISGGSSGGGGAISGVTVTGTAASGDVPVASSSSAGTWALPPGFEFGYDAITGNVTVSSTTESAGTTLISCAAHVFDGGAVLAHYYSPFTQAASAAGATVTVCLFESSTQIGRLGLMQCPSTASGDAIPFSAFMRFTPTAASHTYTVTAFESGGSGTVVAGTPGTGAYANAFIRFTKV